MGRQRTILTVGTTFGHLRVVGPPICDPDHTRYACQCSCGRTIVVIAGNLKSGISKSCGCQKASFVRKAVFKHGGTGTKLYGVWWAMRQRCARKTHHHYYLYGARGIRVCSEWRDFAVFQEWAKATGYRVGLQIDRIDNDGNYEPLNCRWTTRSEQMRNRRHHSEWKARAWDRFKNASHN